MLACDCRGWGGNTEHLRPAPACLLYPTVLQVPAELLSVSVYLLFTSTSPARNLLWVALLVLAHDTVRKVFAVAADHLEPLSGKTSAGAVRSVILDFGPRPRTDRSKGFLAHRSRGLICMLLCNTRCHLGREVMGTVCLLSTCPDTSAESCFCGQLLLLQVS